MALMTIRVHKFEDAEEQCGKVQTEADAYSTALYNKIQCEIDAYPGTNTYNMSSADRSIRNKRTQLSKKGDNFNTLCHDIECLRTDIEASEQALAQRIERIVNNYCNKYGLEKEESWWQQLWDAITPDGFEEALKDLGNWFKNVGRNIKNWYRFEGGREVVNVIVKALVAVIAVIGVVAAAVAIALGGWTLGAIGALIGAVVGLLNAGTQLVYGLSSLSNALQDDPIWARRQETLSNTESFTSTLRHWGQYELALIIDVVAVIGQILQIAQMGKDLVGSISKFGVKGFVKQCTSNIKNNLKALKNGNIRTSFLWGDGSGSTLSNIKKRMDTIKNGVGIVKDTVEFAQDIANGEGAEGLKEYAWDFVDGSVGFVSDMASSDLVADYYKSQYVDALEDEQYDMADTIAAGYKNGAQLPTNYKRFETPSKDGLNTSYIDAKGNVTSKTRSGLMDAAKDISDASDYGKLDSTGRKDFLKDVDNVFEITKVDLQIKDAYDQVKDIVGAFTGNPGDLQKNVTNIWSNIPTRGNYDASTIRSKLSGFTYIPLNENLGSLAPAM